MKTNQQNGGGLAAFFFAIVLLVSLALNGFLLAGCKSSPGKDSQRDEQDTSSYEDVGKLREVADMFDLHLAPDQGSSEIVNNIKNHVDKKPYKGPVLTDEEFEECKSAMPSQRTRDVFVEYHRFVKTANERLIAIQK